MCTRRVPLSRPRAWGVPGPCVPGRRCAVIAANRSSTRTLASTHPGGPMAPSGHCACRKLHPRWSDVARQDVDRNGPAGHWRLRSAGQDDRLCCCG
jgi:hypothetical protein